MLVNVQKIVLKTPYTLLGSSGAPLGYTVL